MTPWVELVDLATWSVLVLLVPIFSPDLCLLALAIAQISWALQPPLQVEMYIIADWDLWVDGRRVFGTSNPTKEDGDLSRPGLCFGAFRRFRQRKLPGDAFEFLSVVVMLSLYSASALILRTLLDSLQGRPLWCLLIQVILAGARGWDARKALRLTSVVTYCTHLKLHQVALRMCVLCARLTNQNMAMALQRCPKGAMAMVSCVAVAYGHCMKLGACWGWSFMMNLCNPMHTYVEAGGLLLGHASLWTWQSRHQADVRYWFAVWRRALHAAAPELLLHCRIETAR